MANAKNPYFFFRVSIAGNTNWFKIIHPLSVLKLNKQQKSNEVSLFIRKPVALNKYFFL
jgi:hypothetical protein